MDPNQECCPPFDPEAWDDCEITWDGKRFVKDRVKSFFHIPLNFGKVMTRNVTLIEKAEAKPKNMIVLSDENSLFGADVYIEADSDVPGATMASLSGTFYAKVFEGPYSKIRCWMKEMDSALKAKGKAMKQLYFYYTTCPRCARKYGKNYVVILART